MSPKLTFNEALGIAERAIAEKIQQSARLNKYEFHPVRLRWENDLFWVFSAGSEQLMEEGYVPGAVSVSVDKTDGHLWTIEEHERYSENVRRLQQTTRPDSVAA